ncbi:MAG: DNA primase [Epsilonproteobacteria bacterium]|nr:DNA primase [Campylobacterota bacterium]
MIDKNSIEQLKNIADIVDVIGNYLELKRAGSNYKALCPFHDEKTPSFVVNPAKQIFHCFGCGVGGDVIKFIMEYEKLSYPEAIEKLASFYNFSLKYTKEKPSYLNLYKVLERVKNFYKEQLTKNSIALNYLLERGFTKESIEKFELGYAPSSKEQLNFLENSLIPLQEALEAGVLGKGENGVYARMVERITFPIFWVDGKVIGFGGRTLSNHPAKYLNSPETKLFHKSRTLYGYHLAKENIFKQKKIIVAEGYLDVIALHQAGLNFAVATLGTALTPSHLPLLKRGDVEVILAYDGDSAGINAAIKASKLLTAHDFVGGVVIFPKGMDPADFIKNKEEQRLRELFKEPKPFVEFVLEEIIKKFDLSNPKEKEKALKEGVEFLKNLSPFLAQEYKGYLAHLLKIPPFRVQLKEKKEKVEIQKVVVRDPLEESIIKTLLLSPEAVERVLDILEPKHFTYHKEEFEAFLKNDLEHPRLREILVDEDILPIKPDRLREELFLLLIRYFEQKIQHLLQDRELSFSKKSFLIRKYRENILKLQKGEIVVED